VKAECVPAEGAAKEETTDHGDDTVGQHQEGLLPGNAGGRGPAGEVGNRPPTGKEIRHDHQGEDLEEHRVRVQDGVECRRVCQ